jgi:putative transposase
MPEYRRSRVAGGTFFFIVVTHRRAKIPCSPLARHLLSEKLRDCQARWPFRVDAIILLPNHLHAVWTLPPDDPDYSRRWAWVKKEFTRAWLQAGEAEGAVSASRRRRHDRGVWQPRFWEHQIRDEHDLERHCDYIHYNPIKHGLVQCPGD